MPNEKVKKTKRIFLYTLVTFGACTLLPLFVLVYLLAPPKTIQLNPADIMQEDAAIYLPAPRAPVQQQENLALLEQAPENYNRKYLEELLKIKEAEGRDNAMIHYVQASWLAPEKPNRSQTKLIGLTIEKGWLPPRSGSLKPYLEDWKPALDKVREGIAVDRSKAIGIPRRTSIPVPDTVFAAQACKILFLEARHLESQGRCREALDNYLDALTLARDHTTPGNLLISYLRGVSIHRNAIGQVRRLAESGALDEKSLLRILDRLEEIERTQGTSAQAHKAEMAFNLNNLSRWLEKPDKGFLDFQTFTGGKKQDFWEFVYSLKDKKGRQNGFGQIAFNIKARRNVGRLGPDYKALFEQVGRFMNAPWRETGREMAGQLEEKVRRSHFLIRNVAPDYTQIRVKDLRKLAELRADRLKIALAAAKLKNGSYPKTLKEVTLAYFPQSPPVDPFSGKPFSYQTRMDGSGYFLWSAGPDGVNDRAGVVYNSSNGPLSKGDIVF